MSNRLRLIGVFSFLFSNSVQNITSPERLWSKKLSTNETQTTSSRKLKANDSKAAIVDLSKDFEEDANYNSNEAAKTLLEFAAADKNCIRGYVVLKHGRKVAGYVRGDLDDKTISPVWSVTKSWTSLIVGMIIEEGKLHLDETLEDVWPDQTNGIWNQVKDADVKRKTTIKSLLSMTSGLVDNPYAHTTTIPGNFFDIAGNTVVDVLNYALYLGPGQIGKFHYFGAGNIFGYVILERTGMSPCQYAAKYIMPQIGINNNEYIWRRDSNKVSNTYFGLEMTTLQMAKLGQLYLQNGLTSETNRLVSHEWVRKSFRPHAYSSNSLPNSPMNPYGYYGYLWWNVIWGDAMCAVGLGGQFVCVWPDKDLVMSISTEYSGTDFSAYAARLIYVASALYFETTTILTKSPTTTPPSVSPKTMMPSTLETTLKPTTASPTSNNNGDNLPTNNQNTTEVAKSESPTTTPKSNNYTMHEPVSLNPSAKPSFVGRYVGGGVMSFLGDSVQELTSSQQLAFENQMVVEIKNSLEISYPGTPNEVFCHIFSQTLIATTEGEVRFLVEIHSSNLQITTNAEILFSTFWTSELEQSILDAVNSATLNIMKRMNYSEHKQFIFSSISEPKFVQPSFNPSLSISPSLARSQNPSQFHSTIPSSNPSIKPSITINLSSNPSKIPSLSKNPSSKPSKNPSLSGNPSSFPSKNPSISSNPSSKPPYNPSASNNPSLEPSKNPSQSRNPSSKPSPKSSVKPSSNPSSYPSISLGPTTSISPSSNPTKTTPPSKSLRPSSKPSISFQPSLSLKPSEIPSTLPSKSLSPSFTPTKSPSTKSSQSPTLGPTEFPSSSPSIFSGIIDKMLFVLPESNSLKKELIGNLLYIMPKTDISIKELAVYLSKYKNKNGKIRNATVKVYTFKGMEKKVKLDKFEKIHTAKRRGKNLEVSVPLGSFLYPVNISSGEKQTFLIKSKGAKVFSEKGTGEKNSIIGINDDMHVFNIGGLIKKTNKKNKKKIVPAKKYEWVGHIIYDSS